MPHFRDLRTEVENAGGVIKGNRYTCPFHENKNSDLCGEFYSGADKETYHCFKCPDSDASGDVYDFMAVLTGEDSKDLFNADQVPSEGHKQPYAPFKSNTCPITIESPVEPLVADAPTYEKLLESITRNLDVVSVKRRMYTFADGSEATNVLDIRFTKEGEGKKTYRPATPVDGGYSFKNMPAPRPLYNLVNITGSQVVIVVEGEKCADALNHYGFISTTSMNGAKNAKHTDWSHLSGKDVIILPDGDGAGAEYASDVMGIIKGKAKSVKLLDPSHYGNHSDIADVIIANMHDEDCHNIIRSIISKATPTDSFSNYMDFIKDQFTNGYRKIYSDFHMLDSWTFGPMAIGKNRINVICGGPACGKTFFNTQLLSSWIEQGVECAALFMEEDEEFYHGRVLSMVAQDSSFLDEEYTYNMRNSPEIEESRDAVNKIMSKITLPDIDDDLTYDYVIKWATEKFKAGAEVVIIDPITAASGSGEIHVADKYLMSGLERITKAYKGCVFLCTHPSREPNGKESVQNVISGGKSIQRFMRGMWYIERDDGNGETMQASIDRQGGLSKIVKEMSAWNCRITIGKGRSGTGQGRKMAFYFNTRTCTFREIGEII